MKKSSAIIGMIATLALSAAPVFASTYSRTPGGSGIVNNPVTFQGSGFDFSGSGSYGVYISNFDASISTSRCINIVTSTPPFNFTISLPPADYTDVVIAPWSYPDCGGSAPVEIMLEGNRTEYDNADPAAPVIFSILAPPSTTILIAPTSTGGTFLAAAENTITDPGTIEIVSLSAGVYLSFYVLRQLIALAAQRRRNNKGR